MLRTLALGTVLAFPLLTGACSSMMGDNGSASTVSRDSQGAGAISGAASMPGGATTGTSGNKNPPSN